MVFNFEKEEKLVRIVGEHWMKYVGPLVITLLFTAGSAALIVFYYFSPVSFPLFMNGVYLFALVLFFFVYHWFFLFLFSDANSQIILTTRRVIYIHHTLFFDETMEEIAYKEVKSVRAETKGLLHNVLKYGNVIFEPGPHIIMVSHPNSMVKDVEQLMGMS